MSQETTNICKQYLSLRDYFSWFIIREFGQRALTVLNDIAIRGESDMLRKTLTEIWFILPDNKYNIKENPRGWVEFLSLIE